LAEEIDALRDEKIDCVFHLLGCPNSVQAGLSEHLEISFLPREKKVLIRILENHSYWTSSEIMKGTYLPFREHPLPEVITKRTSLPGKRTKLRPDSFHPEMSGGLWRKDNTCGKPFSPRALGICLDVPHCAVSGCDPLENLKARQFLLLQQSKISEKTNPIIR